jgi:hypothetical protein
MRAIAVRTHERVLLRTSHLEKTTRTEADEINRLLRAYDDLKPGLRRAFLESARRLSNSVDVGELKALLSQHRIDQAISYLGSRLPSTAFQPLANQVAAGAIESGQLSAQNVGIAEFQFSQINPRTVDFLRRYEGDLITEMTRKTRETVMQVIRQGITAGQNPLDTARDVKDLIGLTRTQAQAVANYRSALQAGSRDALSRGLRDRRFDSSVARAASDGAPLSREKIDNLVGRYRNRYLRYRAETIARTESIRAVSAGNHLNWQQLVESGKLDADQVVRKWVYTHDEKTRTAHRMIPEMNPDGVGLNDRFDTPLGPLLFPCDPSGQPENTINCRCTVIYRFRYKNHEKVQKTSIAPGRRLDPHGPLGDPRQHLGRPNEHRFQRPQAPPRGPGHKPQVYAGGLLHVPLTPRTIPGRRATRQLSGGAQLWHPPALHGRKRRGVKIWVLSTREPAPPRRSRPLDRQAIQRGEVEEGRDQGEAQGDGPGICRARAQRVVE